MRRSILLLLPTCLAFAAVTGCGNKGPLYYPPPAAQAAPSPAPAHPAAAPASASSAETRPLGGN
ncbi:LPS translocon maturation chaperone LptM [Dyella choica]|uniref:Sugar transporter n=1 Tax=Dyella choica TaxID=1927959 RepID=A0A432M5M5_9GAMM|nr:lipoprotein [Dyella choica]RUL75342.1 hypothetical protein EKH80_11500 [Dyella choica]